MDNQNNNLKEDIQNSSNPNFFLGGRVNKCKDSLLKTRLQTIIKSKGLSEADFYNKIGISRQLWYYYSWGVWPCPVEVRVKIAQALEVDSSVLFEPKEEKTA